MTALRALLPVLLAAGLLTACTDDPETRRASGTSTPGPLPTSASPSPSPTATQTGAPPSDEATDPAAPFPADTADDTQEPSGGPLSVVAVRAARQDGYDRVVFELAGEEPGQPGWIVGYTDEPSQQGSGNAVEVAGDATLQVVLTGVGYPFDTGQEEATTDLTPSGTRQVREVDLQGTFEGQFQAFVGVDGQAPFRVFRLSDPARVVVDVRDR